MVDNLRKNRAYGVRNPLQKLTSLPIVAQRAPTTTDKNFSIGQVWIDQPRDDSYILTSITNNQANWQLTTRDASTEFPISEYIVDASGAAGYTTIQAALDAANTAGGGTVYVRPGSYIENLTLYDNTKIVGAVGFGSVLDTSFQLFGTHTPPLTGSFMFENMLLRGNAAIFSSAAAGSSNLVIRNSRIGTFNGWTFDLLNWTGTLETSNVEGVVTSTNDGYINNTGGSIVRIYNSIIGGGNVNALTTSAFTLIVSSFIDCQTSFVTGGALSMDNCVVTRSMSFANNSFGFISNTRLAPGGAPAIVYNTTGVLDISHVSMDSSANPCITGAGAGFILLQEVSYADNSIIAGTVNLSNQGRMSSAGIKVIERSNPTSGVATLVAGTVTVNTNIVTANSRIQLTHQNNAGVLGFVTVSARVVGTSFTITSSNAGDTSDIGWLIIEPQ